MIFSKTKSEKKYSKNVAIFLLCLIFFSLLSITKIQAARQMEGVAFVTYKTGQMVTGDYTVRFAIYSIDRATTDTYPSDTDKAERVWEETQTVTIKNGVLNFNLGQNQELPIMDNASGIHYFLGIRINQDSELIPRKRITSSLFAYNATNASLLNGKKIGTGSGDIPSLNATGKIDLQNLPIGTGAGQLITGNDSRLSDSLTLSGAKYLTLSNQKLTVNKIKLSTDTQGTLPTKQGGTGLTSTPENGKILMGNGSGYAFGSILGAGNVNVASANSNISISLKDIISVGSLAISGDVPTDTANHLYKNGDNLYWGETNLSSGGTTYTQSGSLLQLTNTTLSIKEGILNDGKLCTYSTANGLVCNTEPVNTGIEVDPAFSASPVFGITGGDIINWNAKENILTFSTGLTRVGDTITNTDLGSNQNIFKTITVSGQSDLLADQNSDTLTLAAGSNITLTTNAATDAITIVSTDTNTTYSASGNLLQLAGTVFSVKEGTLNTGMLCTFVTGTGIVCNTSTSSVGHTTATINATSNGLSIDGSQVITLALASTSTIGALSSTDWNAFNNKQAAGAYLTTYTETDPTIYAWAKNSIKPNYTATEIGLGNVENTALSTWAGTTNLTTLGTITTGIWNGTTIAVTNGGTGAGTFSANYLLKGNATSALGSSLIYDDGTNVGIGTMSPSEMLTVNGNLAIYAGSSESVAASNFGKLYSLKAIGDSYTKLLINADGSGNSFIDSATNKTITAVGDATQSNVQSKFGNKSAYFDGSGDYLALPTTNDWSFGANDFTVDMWVYSTSQDANYVPVFAFSGGSNNFSLYSKRNSQSNHIVLQYYNGSSWVLTDSGVTLTTGSWNHFACVRSGDYLLLFLNGLQISSANIAGISFNNTQGWFGTDVAGNYHAGYIDELRISKGIARWTSNFIPPTSSYSEDGGSHLYYKDSINVNSILTAWKQSGTSIYFPMGNIGIGNATPLSKLGITGNASIGATYGVIAAPTSGMIIEGNVGIGTATPTQKLHVNGGDAVITTSDGDINILGWNSVEKTGIFLDNGGNNFGLRATGTVGQNMYFTAKGDWIFENANGWSKPVVIKNSGNVGIGTTNPLYKLDISGDVNITGNYKVNGVNLGSNMTNPMTTVGDIIYGGTAGAPTRLVGAAGFLTSTGSAAPTWTLALADYFTQYALLTGRSGGQIITGGTLANDTLVFKANSATSANVLTSIGMQFKVGDSAGTNALTILNNGNVGIGTTGPGELLSLGSVGATRGVISLAGNTSGKVIIQPSATAGSYTLTLPMDDGASSQVLQTDGSGILSWVAKSTASAFTVSTDGLVSAPIVATGRILADNGSWIVPAVGYEAVSGVSVVPSMTSNTTPSGVVSASSAYVTTPAWQAFSSNHNGWVTSNTGLGTPQWLQYKFPSSKIITSYSIQPWSNDLYPDRWLTGWHLDGSNDGASWTVLDTRTHPLRTWSPYRTEYFSIMNTATYSYYRLVITANGGNSYVGLQHFELFETYPFNTATGENALFSNTTGLNNTANGMNALFSNITGSGGVALGFSAGKYETDSNAFYINNVDQTTLANDKNYSLLYGTFSGVAGSLSGQKLVINGKVGIGTTNPLAFLDIAAPTIGSASLHLSASSAIDPSSPNIGDLWFNGTNLYFRKDGFTSQDLLVRGSSQWGDIAGGINYTAGNVGIGTTTIPSRLTIDGALSLSESANAPDATSGFGKLYARSGTSGNDSYTKFLLHSDGPGNLFVDSAYDSKRIIAGGSATQTNVKSKFGGRSAYFNGTNDYLSVTSSDDWTFGTGEFTIDAWIFKNAVSSVRIFSRDNCDGTCVNRRDFMLISDASNHLGFGIPAQTIYFTTTAIPTGEWVHVAASRSGATLYLAINGNVESFNVGSGYSLGGSTLPLDIGFYAGGGGSSFFDGYMDEVRISKGIARWTSNFTPPTDAYSSAQLFYKNSAGEEMALGNSFGASFTSPWGTSGASIFYNSGNVGIGTTNPLYKLDIAGDVNITGNYKVNGVNLSSGMTNPMTTVGDLIYGGVSGAPTRLAGSAGFLTYSGSTLAWTTQTTDYFTQYALLAGRSGGQIITGGTSANETLILKANSATTGNAFTNVGMQFKVGDLAGTNALTILNDGNVGIGTTAPGALLSLNGANTAYRGQLSIQSTDFAQITLYDGATTNTNLGTQLYYDVSTKKTYLNSYDGISGAQNGTLILNASGGKVGIGITSPFAALDVAGVGSTTCPYTLALFRPVSVDPAMFYGIAVEKTGYGNFMFGMNKNSVTGQVPAGSPFITTWDTTQGISLGRGGSSSGKPYYSDLYIAPSGNVGIGTTGPLSLLHVGNGTQTAVNGSQNIVRLANGTNTQRAAYLALSKDSGGNSVEMQLESDGQNASGTGAGGVFGTSTNHPLDIRTNNTSRLYIQSSGNVGIGSTAPGARLQVVGSDSLNTSFSANLSGATGTGLVVTNSGNVGIGTTSPAKLLEVVNNVSSPAATWPQLRITNTADYISGLSIMRSGGTAGPEWMFYRYGSANSDHFAIGVNTVSEPFGISNGATGGVTIGTGYNSPTFYAAPANGLIAQGNVGIGTTNPSQLLTVYNGSTTGTYTTSGWAHSSDARLKTNIMDVTNPLDKINSLSGVYFNWKANPNADRQIGLIAQDTLKVLPEVVVGNEKDGYGIAYGNLSALLIEGVKAQQAQLSSLSTLTNILQNSNTLQDQNIQKLNQALILLTTTTTDQSASTNQKITSIQTNLISSGSQLNLLSTKLNSANNLLSQNTQPTQELSFYQFKAQSSELSSPLENQTIENNQFDATYDSPNNFQEINLQLHPENQLNLEEKDQSQTALIYDVYIEDPALLEDYHTELGNIMDQKEFQWDKLSHPYFTAGWNEVRLPITDGTLTGTIDWQYLSYFRAYFKFNANTNLKFKNIRLETKAKYQPLAQALNTQNLDLWNNVDQGTALKSIFSELDSMKMQELVSLQVTTKLTNDLKAMQDQVTLLQKQADAFTQFLLAFDVSSIDNFAKKNAPLNTFTGQLEAEGMVAGAFSVKVVDESAATIGKSAICQSAKALQDGACVIYYGANAQMIPANGRSVTIKTTSVTAGSKIFVTPKLAITQPLAVTNIIPGVSFNVEVKDVILEDVDFDWFIVEEK